MSAMNKGFLEAICNFDAAPDLSRKQQGAIMDSCSVKSYIKSSDTEGRQAIPDAGIHRAACALFEMPRAKRRTYLARVSDSNRRLLLKEGARIKQRITDSGIKYPPRMCWAISDAMRNPDGEGVRVLDSMATAGRLPREVDAWYDSYIMEGKDARQTRVLAAKLGAYQLMGRQTRVTDDDAVDQFLAAGRQEENALHNTVDEAIEAAVGLSEEAQSRLNEVKNDLQSQAEDFIGTMVESVASIIPDIVAEQSAQVAEENAEDIVASADENLDADAEAAKAAEDAAAADDLGVFGLDEDGEPVGDSISMVVGENGDVQISTATSLVNANGAAVSATVSATGRESAPMAPMAPEEEQVDFTDTISEDTFEHIEEHLSDSARAVLDSLGQDDPGVVSRLVSVFRDWLKDNYTAMRDEPDSRHERLEKLLNDLHAILKPTGIMLSVDEENLIYDGTESLVRFTNDGMEIGSLMYSYDANPTASNTMLRNAGNEFSIIIGSLDPERPTDSADNAVDPNGAGEEDGTGVEDAADGLYDTIMANIDSLVGMLDEMGAPAKKADKYMRPWFDRLDEGERKELEEAVAALPANKVSDADDNNILSDEAKQEVLNKVSEEVKRRLKESGIEITDDRITKTWTNYIDAIGEGADHAEQLRKIRAILSDEEWAQAITEWNKRMDHIGLGLPLDATVDEVIEDDHAETFLHILATYMPDEDLATLYAAITDDADDDDIQVDGEPEDIEDGILNGAKKLLSKAKLKVGDQLQIGNQWATVVKKKLTTFMVKFKNGTYKEYKYPKKMSSVPDQDNAAIVTEDSAPQASSSTGDAGMNARLPEVHPNIHDGEHNAYDMPHSLETFAKVRNTREALEDILRVVSQALGLAEPLTAEQYQSGNVEERIIGAVSDSTFDMNQLDLICPTLYKRKFTDSAWMVDSIDDLVEGFGVTIPDSFKGMSAILSARPIADSVLTAFGCNTKITFPYDGNRCLYVAPFTEE